MPPVPSSTPANHAPRRGKRWVVFACVGLLLVVLAAVLRPRIAAIAQLRHALDATSVEADGIEELLDASGSAEANLRALWDSGRIPHRRVALGYVIHRPAVHRDLLESFVRDAVVDPDEALRELALGSLIPGGTTDVAVLLGPQLQDRDPALRALALHTLRRVGHPGWTPIALPLAQDPDPTVATSADALLRRWTGLDSGLRFLETGTGGSSLIPKTLSPDSRQRVDAIGQERRAWWNTHASASPVVTLPPPMPPVPRPLDDWSLPDLDGRQRSLSEFRGRVVLVNFWATWCTACLEELPVLIRLQEELPKELVVLGVSLDTGSPGASATPDGTPPNRQAISRTVRTVAARHRIPYPILLDPENEIGRRFDGGELPTQVLIDGQGRIRRRFVGGRTLETWKALVLEASR